jgi:hypothetical protein
MRGITTDNNDVKRYFKEIKMLLPAFGDSERMLFSTMMAEVDDYAGSNPDSSYEQIVSVFGEPRRIVSQYIADADPEYLLKQIRTSRRIKAMAIVIIIAVVIVAVAIIGIKYTDYLKGQIQYIDREVTEITDE